MPQIEDLVTAVIVHYKTANVTRRCFRVFREHYNNIPIILIDNSGYNKHSDAVYEEAKQDNNTNKVTNSTTIVFNSYNMHHGPAMDLGIKMSSTPIVFIMDSDLIIEKPNLLEEMYNTTIDKKEWLVVGNLADVNADGFGREATKINLDVKYCSPKCMLVNRSEYFNFPPFIFHGAPCIETMKGVKQANKTHMLLHFDCTQYSRHLGGVTQRKYGLDGVGGIKIPPFI